MSFLSTKLAEANIARSRARTLTAMDEQLIANSLRRLDASAELLRAPVYGLPPCGELAADAQGQAVKERCANDEPPQEKPE